jgi:hypothetical protein
MKRTSAINVCLILTQSEDLAISISAQDNAKN